jgi:hypothetical protein
MTGCLDLCVCVCVCGKSGKLDLAAAWFGFCIPNTPG